MDFDKSTHDQHDQHDQNDQYFQDDFRTNRFRPPIPTRTSSIVSPRDVMEQNDTITQALLAPYGASIQAAPAEPYRRRIPRRQVVLEFVQDTDSDEIDAPLPFLSQNTQEQSSKTLSSSTLPYTSQNSPSSSTHLIPFPPPPPPTPATKPPYSKQYLKTLFIPTSIQKPCHIPCVDPNCKNKCTKKAEEKKEHYRKQMVAWRQERDRDVGLNKMDVGLNVRVEMWMQCCEREGCKGYSI